MIAAFSAMSPPPLLVIETLPPFDVMLYPNDVAFELALEIDTESGAAPAEIGLATSRVPVDDVALRSRYAFVVARPVKAVAYSMLAPVTLRLPALIVEPADNVAVPVVLSVRLPPAGSDTAAVGASNIAPPVPFASIWTLDGKAMLPSRVTRPVP